MTILMFTKFKQEDEENYKRVDSKNKYEGYLYSATSSLTDELKAKLDESDLETINTQIDNHRQWLETHQEESHDVYDERMKEIEDDVPPVGYIDDGLDDEPKNNSQDVEFFRKTTWEPVEEW